MILTCHFASEIMPTSNILIWPSHLYETEFKFLPLLLFVIFNCVWKFYNSSVTNRSCFDYIANITKRVCKKCCNYHHCSLSNCLEPFKMQIEKCMKEICLEITLISIFVIQTWEDLHKLLWKSGKIRDLANNKSS